MQKALSRDQIEAFYHDEFVEDQILQFIQLVGVDSGTRNVTDMGGGCGFFAKRLSKHPNLKLKVVDMDISSVVACRNSGIEAIRGDAINPAIAGDENIVTFNLILHHLVGDSELDTSALQTKALAVWSQRPHIQSIFVNEYIYESYLGNFSGWLIFRITKSPILSMFGRVVSVLVPSLKANTFGVGVRFRASKEWCRLFEAAGYVVKSAVVGKNEHVSLPRRLLLIRCIRRDSFLLEPKASQ